MLILDEILRAMNITQGQISLLGISKMQVLQIRHVEVLAFISSEDELQSLVRGVSWWGKHCNIPILNTCPAGKVSILEVFSICNYESVKWLITSTVTGVQVKLLEGVLGKKKFVMLINMIFNIRCLGLPSLIKEECSFCMASWISISNQVYRWLCRLNCIYLIMNLNRNHISWSQEFLDHVRGNKFSFIRVVFWNLDDIKIVKISPVAWRNVWLEFIIPNLKLF